MSRYSVRDHQWEHQPLLELFDTASGARALIWPGFGNNCLALQLSAGGRSVELITPPPSPEALRAAPSRWGTPLLFPWPGRIPAGESTWRGRLFRVPELDAAGNAIHGLVKDRPWRVTGRRADDSAAELRCTITAADLPETRPGFPFDWALSVRYTLSDGALELTAEVDNRGGDPMPFGFGAHPYFTVPFGPDASAGEMRLQVPARQKWDTAALRNLPEALAAGSAFKVPLSAGEDLTSPAPLGAGPRDSVLTTLDARSGWSVSTLHDPAARLTLSVEATADFRSIVLFAPADRNAFCIEPWTCPPNVFNAARWDEDQADLLVLEPGGRWEGRIRMRLTEEDMDARTGS